MAASEERRRKATAGLWRPARQPCRDFAVPGVAAAANRTSSVTSHGDNLSILAAGAATEESGGRAGRVRARAE